MLIIPYLKESDATTHATGSSIEGVRDALTMLPSWAMTLSREGTDLGLILSSAGQLNMCSLSQGHSCSFINFRLLLGEFSKFSMQLSSAERKKQPINLILTSELKF